MDTIRCFGDSGSFGTLLCLQAQQGVPGAAVGLSASSSAAPKATFPAYSQPAPSAANTGSTVAKPATPITSKPATLTTTSATSKLIHPDEDISLVSVHIWLHPCKVSSEIRM